MPKFPEVTVKLTDIDSNAMHIVSATCKALHRHGVDRATIQEYKDEALSDDYDNVIITTMRWVKVK